jgi:hypothetical protein
MQVIYDYDTQWYGTMPSKSRMTTVRDGTVRHLACHARRRYPTVRHDA